MRSVDPLVIDTRLGMRLGDSVSVNGACLTVARKTTTSFSVDLLNETRKKTNLGQLKAGAIVNLERALKASSRMGGHWVSGHVDEVGAIESMKDGEIVVRFRSKFAPYLIPKGSITIDGVSLTVVDLGKRSFSCHLIPHTLHHTSLKDRKKGDLVNLEYDIVGKYLYRFAHV